VMEMEMATVRQVSSKIITSSGRRTGVVQGEWMAMRCVIRCRERSVEACDRL
jgi:hypothetical protein